MGTVFCDLIIMETEDNQAIIYRGSEGEAQMQIAIRYLHDIPNSDFVVKMKNNVPCQYCNRWFQKLFSFIDSEDADGVDVCHACIAHLGPERILAFLFEQKNHDNSQ